MLTKFGDPSCLKTEIEGKQGHALRKRQKASKTNLMKKFVKKLVPSPRWLLNGKGVQRIFGVQKFEVGFGSFCERGTKVCEQLRKRKVDMCCLEKVK